MKDYEKYMSLDIDTSLIGLEKGDSEGGYFCTPAGAKVFGWENGIHYCFIEGYGEMAFAVNPMPLGEEYVYPLAENFTDLLRLILYSGSITAIEQIIWMEKDRFEEFVKGEDNAYVKGQEEVLNIIGKEFGISPMEDAYEYVKNLQNRFCYDNIKYTDEYYDTLGLPYPDGRNQAETGFGFSAVEFKFIKETEE